VPLEPILSLLCSFFNSNFSVSGRRIIKNFEMGRKCKIVIVAWFEGLQRVFLKDSLKKGYRQQRRVSGQNSN